MSLVAFPGVPDYGYAFEPEAVPFPWSGRTYPRGTVELFEQLRGEAANQVDRARVGLAHNIGGLTAVSAVSILEGPAGGH